MLVDEMKNCPYCDEPIRQNAIKCKHCGSMLVEDTNSNGLIQNQDTLIRNALGDRYEILGVLGKGGMATVYKAIQKNLGREVAIKVIHQNLVHDTEFISRFTREARVSASLNHPNIITIYDVGSVGSVHYITMELLNGLTLHEYLKQKKKLPSSEVVELFIPLSKALEYIHQRKLVHRDLKSSNIFITDEGRPVLMDFGIVYAGNETKLSQAGAIVGTPEYMSPEQAEGKLQTDHRSDIYSLGIILFECLVGRVPFHADNPLGTIHKVITQDPLVPHQEVSTTPLWLSNLTLACIEKNREHRVQSASELVDYLSQKTFASKQNQVYHSSGDSNSKQVKPDLSKESIKQSKIKHNTTPKLDAVKKNKDSSNNESRKVKLIGLSILTISLVISWLLINKAGIQPSTITKEISNVILNDKTKVTKSGYKYNVVRTGDGKAPAAGEILVLNMMFKDDKDSIWSDSRKGDFPTMVKTQDSIPQGDIVLEIFQTLTKGDSVTFHVTAKDLFQNTFKSPIPPGLDSTSVFTFEIGVTDIISEEEARKLQDKIMAKLNEKDAIKAKEQLASDITIIDKYLIKKSIVAQKTISGLRYIIEKKGKGETAKSGQTVRVNYTGFLLDGRCFDSSIESIARANNVYNEQRLPYEPIELVLGYRQVIPGWDEALGLMNKGAKMTVYLPSGLAYGPQKRSDIITENSILIFELELIDIK